MNVDSTTLATRIEILATTCRRHEATLDALLEAMVKLHTANSALRAENASLRTRNAVSMVERVKAKTRGRSPQLKRRRDGVMSGDRWSGGY
jgi:regulator of replication initiation timing